MNCGHNDDLNDDLDDIFGGPVTKEDIEHGKQLAKIGRVSARSGETKGVGQFVEKCPSCRGRGRFISYSGRDCGPCFKCKGKGTLTFKSDADTRAKQAAQRADRKAREQREIAEQAAAWGMANAADHAWMLAKSDRFDFARSMVEALTKYGHLTEKQHATVTRLRLADAERDAARKAEREAREANAPVVDVSLIEKAFATAQSKGIKRPKMILNGLKFSLAPAHGRNAGALYVVRKDDDQYLGKIMGGRFTRVRECTVEQEAEIVKIASNPHAEAVAYGQRTGNCCICNRELTNHASIDAGIGPICAEKYGW
jgi:hypothetical protein